MCSSRCIEASLDDLFSDIAMELLMRCDGVKESDVRALLDQLREPRSAVSAGIASKRDASMRTNRALKLANDMSPGDPETHQAGESI